MKAKTEQNGIRNRAQAALATCAAVGAVAAIAAPSASAAPATITGNALNAFDMATYPHDAGTIAQLVVTGSSHNATATANGPDGKVLFSSATISGGSTPVNGTQYLALGSYPFICTVHPSTMSANLNVNAGAPLPQPDVELKVKSKSLDQALRKAEVKVKATITGGSGEAAEVNLFLGKKKIGVAESTTSTRVLKIELTNKGHSALENKDKAKVKATATIDFGEPATAKGTLK